MASLTDVFENKNGVEEANTSKITLEMLRELEDSEPEPKKIKVEDVVKKEEPYNGYADEAEEEEEEYIMISVGGEQVPCFCVSLFQNTFRCHSVKCKEMKS